MYPYMNFFDHSIPSYSVMIILGIVIGILFGLLKSKSAHIPKEDMFYMYCFAVIGVIVGGKLLYMLTSIKEIIIYREVIFKNIENFSKWMSGGFVFYGSLIGAILMVLIYCKKYKINMDNALPVMITSIPLIHSIGRIGCLLAGCCYGREYHGFGHIYMKNSTIAPTDIPLFPVQIVESFLNLVIFFILLALLKKKFSYKRFMGIYFCMYAVVRFILETQRGDIARGYIGILSTSQWISIALLIIGICFIAFCRGKTENAEQNKI